MHFVPSRTVLRPARLLLAAGLLGIVVLGGSSAASATPGDDQELTTAINTFLHESESPLADRVSVEVSERDGDFARVTVTPNNPDAADQATAFLRHENGAWTLVSLGTAFLPEDCAALGIPATVGCGD
jgi:hypothetical protein